MNERAELDRLRSDLLTRAEEFLEFSLMQARGIVQKLEDQKERTTVDKARILAMNKRSDLIVRWLRDLEHLKLRELVA